MADETPPVAATIIHHTLIGKGLATAAVCAMGCVCMYITNSATGIGWVTFGVIIIWGC